MGGASAVNENHTRCGMFGRAHTYRDGKMSTHTNMCVSGYRKRSNNENTSFRTRKAREGEDAHEQCEKERERETHTHTHNHHTCSLSLVSKNTPLPNVVGITKYGYSFFFASSILQSHVPNLPRWLLR